MKLVKEQLCQLVLIVLKVFLRDDFENGCLLILAGYLVNPFLDLSNRTLTFGIEVNDGLDAEHSMLRFVIAEQDLNITLTSFNFSILIFIDDHVLLNLLGNLKYEIDDISLLQPLIVDEVFFNVEFKVFVLEKDLLHEHHQMFTVEEVLVFKTMFGPYAIYKLCQQHCLVLPPNSFQRQDPALT